MIFSVKYLLIGAILLLTLELRAVQTAQCDPIQFATDFYVAVHEESPTENVIVSPLSVQTALGLLLMGSEGTTAEEIIKGLHLDTAYRPEIAAHFREILSSYSTGGTLKLANKLYTKTSLDILSEFSDLAKKQFNSETESIDFSESERAAQTINSWVERITENKIRDLVSGDQFDGDTRLVIVNAIHFKAAWLEPFKEYDTKKRDFWIGETESQQVDMMYNYRPIVYGELDDLDARVGFLPYRNTDLEMMIVVPNSRTGLSGLEKGLRTYNFTNIKSNLSEEWTDIMLPKFEIETTVDLKIVLAKMGIQEMFSDTADLPGILNSSESLKVDGAVHKAFISVDEEGTEAAAATMHAFFIFIPFPLEMLVPMSFGPQLFADRPFLFAIVGPTGVPFIGSIRKL